MSVPFVIVAERPLDAPLAEGLIARAFGPGRYAKSAERLREGAVPMAELSFLAWLDRRAVGCVRLWPIMVGDQAALLLGPLAVEAEIRGAGVGAALVVRACEAAATTGHERILLVGDTDYFGPLGFSIAAGVRLPGPVDPRRVLAKSLVGDASPCFAGLARPAPVPSRQRELALP